MNVIYLIKTKNEANKTLTRFTQDIVIPNGFRLERLCLTVAANIHSSTTMNVNYLVLLRVDCASYTTTEWNQRRAGCTLMNIARCFWTGRTSLNFCGEKFPARPSTSPTVCPMRTWATRHHISGCSEQKPRFSIYGLLVYHRSYTWKKLK